MTITKQYLAELFNQYNKEYFDDELPKCRMTTTQAKSYYAMYLPSNKPIIYVCRYVHWDEESLKMTILHEMLHHYIMSVAKSKFYILPHGFIFNHYCRKFKKKHGIDLRIHKVPHPYFYKEKIPTTFFQKMRRYLNYRLSF